jgi:hypothetical protein
MTFREAILDWCEKGTLAVSNQKNPGPRSCDNLLLFTGTYIQLLDTITPNDAYLFSKFVRSCEVVPGLFNRYPGFHGQESWDDLIGVVAGSHRLGLQYGSEVLYYGEDHDWNWNNVQPGVINTESMLGRFPQFVAMLRVAGRETPSYAEQILFAACCIRAAFDPPGDTSGRCLQFLMNRVVFGKCMLMDLSIFFWRWKMKRVYPGGMRDVYKIYFGPEHPFAVYGPTDFE